MRITYGFWEFFSIAQFLIFYFQSGGFYFDGGLIFVQYKKTQSQGGD